MPQYFRGEKIITKLTRESVNKKDFTNLEIPLYI